MPRLVDLVASYVPRAVQCRFAFDPSPLTAPEVVVRTGAVFFADISGFTALTEHFSHRGPAGLEQLTSVLNAHFERLISLVIQYSGDVFKLSGDGLVAVWHAEAAELTAAY